MTLRYNFGSSGELQKQIEAGAPVDLFISAAQRQMDELEKKALIAGATRHVFARNVLTVIKPVDSKIDIAKPADLLDPRVTKIVVGNPKTVPAGQYAEESLKTLGLGTSCSPSSSSRRTCARPSTTWPAARSTPASSTPPMPHRGAQVKEAFRPAEDTYRPVLYPVAVVAGSKMRRSPRRFSIC